jgi:hypothetical protein
MADMRSSEISCADGSVYVSVEQGGWSKMVMSLQFETVGRDQLHLTP